MKASEEGAAAEPGFDYDVVIVGSGFGGSVSALRLTEKGYRVAVLEAGRRFTPETLPKNSWDHKNYLWAPPLGLYGIQRFHVLKDVMVLGGAGVGGGSLNYANTLYVPPKAFFQDPQWKDITDWSAELAPFYDQAQRMLGVRTNPTVTPSDVHLRDAADKLGYGDTFHLAPVGVFFGDGNDVGGEGAKVAPGTSVEDPYFGGEGPRRKSCTECGECMTGCRHGAKNTLTENYLYLAEKNGAQILPMTTVTRIREDGDGYAVDVRATDSRSKNPAKNGFRTIRAPKVVVSAGTYSTQKLLHEMRDDGHLPRISAKLGELTRTNSEALVGSMTTDKRYGKRVDFTQGVAITSSVHPDEHTHIEPVRYGKGSNAMSLMSIMQVPGGSKVPLLRFAKIAATRPHLLVQAMNKHRWSERVIIGLVMQSLDNSIIVSRKKSGPGKGQLTSRQGHGAPNPKWIPAAEESARAVAGEINGYAGSGVSDLLGRTLTAHFLGGCVIGDSPERGVIDPYQRLFGYPGISIADGSTVSANLGVNPSLTITAQAERAMSMWPNKGEEDPRPAQGEAYRPVAPVAPLHPTVPAGAYGELRLPLLAIPVVPPKAAPAAVEDAAEAAVEAAAEAE
ncbi:GMC family oxidoreductase N-terminal domain-containing protein [Streptacidiphilus sp. EB129]|uniref:GMC family oxidoreductase N-terminal domain-containing protein n=1 Tax=Streptacidiphilus sp. EB129 TaxID=3156262 RepID=UPI003513D36F